MDKFNKQPSEVLDFDIEADDWLNTNDTIITATSVVVPTGLTLQSTTIFNTGRSVKVWVAAGANGVTYKITTTMTTTDGRVKEHDWQLKVKEI